VLLLSLPGSWCLKDRLFFFYRFAYNGSEEVAAGWLLIVFQAPDL
jgi:hypothetical protein